MPDASPQRLLGFTEADLTWCLEHEEQLWREVEPLLHQPLRMEGYGRYFSQRPASDIPCRTGYFLGWRMVSAFLERNPGVDLAAAVRLPAERYM